MSILECVFLKQFVRLRWVSAGLAASIASSNQSTSQWLGDEPAPSYPWLPRRFKIRFLEQAGQGRIGYTFRALSVLDDAQLDAALIKMGVIPFDRWQPWIDDD